MIDKKYLVMILLLVCLVSLSSVSAEEIANDESADQTLSVSVDSDVLADENTGTFSELNTIISAGETVDLDRNYTFNESSDSAYLNGIKISANTIINGNGYTIDGNKLARIFYVDGESVTIKNVTFVNGGAYNDDYGGGAIYSRLAGLTITDSTFIENSAKNGGAIYSRGSGLTVENSTFIENIAGQDGGAVFTFNSAVNNKITSSIFKDNQANGGSSTGNTIYWRGNGGVLENSIIIDNAASSVYTSTDGNDEASLTANNNWWGNTEDNYNETPNVQGYTTADNWLFLNKTSTEGKLRAGDIYTISFSLGNLYDNTEKSVTTYTNELPEIDVTLTTVNATTEDSAIVSGNVFDVEYTPTYYGNTTLTINYSSVEYSVNFTTIKKYTYTDLQDLVDNVEGDAFTVPYDITYDNEYDGENYINGILINKELAIDGNGSTISGNNSARILNITADGVTINNITLTNGSADNGSAIYTNSSLNINNSIFNKNSAVYFGGAIYTTSDIVIDNSIFDSNNITYRPTSDTENGGSAIFGAAGTTVNVSNSNFTNNYDNYKAEEQTYGAVALANNGNFENCIFTNNSGQVGGSITGVGYLGSKDGTITVKNSRFENNTNVFQGGAIYAQDTNLVVEDSSFSNNYVEGKIGDEYWGSGAAIIATMNLIVKNSNFTNNKAEYNAGAIYAMRERSDSIGDSLIENCIFENNYAGNYYGAIYYMGNDNLLLKDSKFINNTAKATMAGAIGIASHDNKVIIIDTEFINNTADTSAEGGAIYIRNGNLEANNTVFSGNKANNGGAIYAVQGGITLNNVTIENSIATNNGGAIYAKGSLTVNTTNLINNTAANGGAIYVDSSASDVLITGSLFINNTATTSGDAIQYAATTGTISDSIFISNGSNHILTATSTGLNADNNWWGNNATNYNTAPKVTGIELGNWLFINATATPDRLPLGDKSVVLFSLNSYNKTESSVEEYDISKLPIVNLTVEATNGTINTSSIIINNRDDIEYTANEADLANVTVTYENVIFTIHIINIKEGTYTDLQYRIDNADGTLVLPYDFTYDNEYDLKVNSSFVNGVLINKEITIDGNSTTISGNDSARIFNITGNNTTIKDITLTNGNASEGGAIYWTGANATITDAVFTDNTATGDFGGAIRLSSVNAQIIDSTFTNNIGANGGAIYWGGANGTLKSSEFINNTANTIYSGGAIFWYGANGTIINSKFTNNTANQNGGAVAWFDLGNDSGKYGTIINSTFTNNSASRSGGAIYWTGNNANITESTFTNNSASENGGAIFISGANSTISNSIFTNNTATHGGSAIYWAGVNGTLTNITASNNNAGASGTVLWIGANGILKDSIFTDNNASGNGGVIYWAGSDGNITNSTFTNNIASGTESNAGAIFWEGANGNIENSIFEGNEATVSGAAIYWAGATGTLTNVTVTRNKKATNGAVFWNGANGNIQNSTFIENNATNGGALYIFTGATSTNVTSSIFINNTAKVSGDAILWLGKDGNITNSILISYETNYIVQVSGEGSNLDANYNWWGDTADTYNDTERNRSDNNLANWLFLNATSTPDSLYTGENSTVVFTLNNLYTKEGNKVSTADISNLPLVNLTLTNNDLGNINVTSVIANNGEEILFIANNYGTANITATFENVEFTLNITIIKAGTYHDLQHRIDTAYGTLVLPYDFTFDPEYDVIINPDFINGVLINRDLTIDGNGSTISGNNSAKIFNITGEVTLKNITLTNANGTDFSAIYTNSTLTITDSVLEANNASAIYVDNGNVTIENTKFNDNNNVLNIADGNVTVKDSEFTNNINENGVIILAKGELNIANSNFTSNDADVGVINIAKDTVANISGSIFNESSISINNSGKLALDKNNVSNAIYNYGKITSATYLTVLNNETVNVATGKPYNITVTLEDDNGNIIYGSKNLTLYINSSTETKEVSYSSDDNAFVYEFKPENGGVYTINATYSDAGLSNLTIKSAELNSTQLETNITFEYIYDGENLTIVVKVNPSDATGKITLLINNEEIVKTIENGQVNETYPNVLPGVYYYINAKYEGDTSYLASSNKTTYYLEQEESFIIITPKIIDYQNINVTITMIPEAANGTVIVTVNSQMYELEINETGQASILVNSPTGEYSITARYLGNKYYLTSTNSTQFTVDVKGTYTDLQNIINKTENGLVIDLPYNFTYSPDIDNVNFPNGIIIDKAITINGNGFTINGNNDHRIFTITAKDVVLNNINIVNGSGSAIYIDTDATVTLTNTTELNAKLDDDYVVYNNGTLSLDGNNFNSTIFNNGTITSKVIITVLNNETINTTENTLVFVNITDDNGNVIVSASLNITDGNTTVATKTNDTNNYAEFPTADAGYYVITVSDEGLTNTEINTATIINNKGTFTDLQRIIDEAEENAEIELPYDFAYNEGVDGEKFINGVLISKALTIKGNGHTISGSNASRIFNITGKATLIEVTLTDGSADNGSVIYVESDAELTLANSTLSGNNTAVYNKGTLSLENNTISNPIYNDGTITSETHISVLNNETVYGDTVTVFANITDDNGNEIISPSLVFNDGSKDITAETNATSTYITYETAGFGTYHITAFDAKLKNTESKAGTIINIKGTFTDLERLINDTDDVLELPYDFTYNSEIDGDKNVIVINKAITINGNGYTISGNSSGNIFNVNSTDVVLNNINFANATTAVYVESDAELTLANSTFKDNEVDVNNTGSLALENNTLATPIYNNGKITSETYIIILNNETIEVIANKEYTITAVIVDDNNNTIVSDDTELKFIIGTNNITATYSEENHTYTATYLPRGGVNLITTDYNTGLSAVVVKTAILNANRVESNVSINITQNGNDVTIIANVTPDDATGYVLFTINNVVYNITVENGIATLELTDLVAKEYNVNITYSGDGSYLESTNGSSFNVEFKQASIIVSAEPVTYGENATITATVNAEGNVTFIVNGKSYTVEIKDGVATLDTGDIVIGNNNIVAIYSGNPYYASGANSTILTVEKASTDVVIETAESYDEFSDITITVKVNESAAGYVNIIVNGENHIVEISAGTATYTIENATSGDYSITAKYLGDDNYNANESTSSFVVNPQPGSDITITVGDVYVYGDEIIITLNPVNSTGTVSVTINGKTYEVVNNQVNATGLKAGEYTIVANLDGDGTYSASTSNATFKVEQIDSSVIIKTENITDGENLVINVEVPADATGNVIITVGDESYYATISEGIASVTVKALEIGKYPITATYTGDDKYIESTNTTDVNVKAKETLTLIVEAESIEFGKNATVTVTVPANLTGSSVTIIIDGKEYEATVSDEGIAVFEIENLNTGKYEVIATFAGNSEYYAGSNTTTITVVETFSYVKVTADSIKDGEDLIINIEVPADATEGVIIKITGENTEKSYYVAVEDGAASLTVSDLGVGEYKITATYTGDENYASSENTTDVTVEAKQNTQLNVNAETVSVGETAVINVTGSPELSGSTVKVYVNGDENEATFDENGVASVEIPDLSAGEYDIEVIFDGNDNYYGNVTQTTLTVSKKESSVTINTSDITEGADLEITVEVPEDAEGGVIVTVDGDSYYAPIVDGYATLTVSNLEVGEHEITAVYTGDDNYESDTSTSSVNVTAKADTPIEITANPIKVGQVVTIQVTVPTALAGQTVTITVNGNSQNAIVNNNGIATANVAGLAVGNYEVTASYAGGASNYANSTSTTLVVSKDNDSVNVSVSENLTEGDSAVIKITAPSDANGIAIVDINDKLYAAAIKNGTATIEVSDLRAGNYTATVLYLGDDKYSQESETFNITISKKEIPNIVISAPDVTKYYHGSERFNITVTDEYGDPVANKTVAVTINGVTSNRTTDSLGRISMALGLNSGNYTAVVSADNITINATIVIKATITAPDITKIYRNGTQYYATFVDGNGNLLRNTMVTFNINGVYYDRTTNDQGTARLNINLNPGVYTLTAINPSTQEQASSTITVNSPIVDNHDLVKTYRNASQYTVRIIGSTGNPVGAGVSVTFNINGMMYTRTTNDQGIATLNINLQAGQYLITAEYNSYRVSNTITVLPA